MTAPDGHPQLNEDAFLADFAGDVPTQRARAPYAVRGHDHATLTSERTTAAAWHDRPTWYQVSTRDRDTSHLSPVTQPGPVSAGHAVRAAIASATAVAKSSGASTGVKWPLRTTRRSTSAK